MRTRSTRSSGGAFDTHTQRNASSYIKSLLAFALLAIEPPTLLCWVGLGGDIIIIIFYVWNSAAAATTTTIIIIFFLYF